MSAVPAPVGTTGKKLELEQTLVRALPMGLLPKQPPKLAMLQSGTKLSQLSKWRTGIASASTCNKLPQVRVDAPA